jgi:hypothetical protein
MAYETLTVSSLNSAVKAEPAPAVVAALSELSQAVRDFAVASEAFLAARSTLNEATGRYAKLLDIVAKEREQAGV